MYVCMYVCMYDHLAIFQSHFFVERDLADYCVWSGPDVPLTPYQADEHCAKLGGEVISMYDQSDVAWLKLK